MKKTLKGYYKMEKTAVEWLGKELESYGDPQFCEIEWEQLDSLIKQAKEMEKEQLKQLMWDLTEIDTTKSNKGLIIDNRFDTYWDETFKSE